MRLPPLLLRLLPLSLIFDVTSANPFSNVTNVYEDYMPTEYVNPVCSDEEALFQLQFLSFNEFGPESSFKVSTANNQTPHAECTFCTIQSPAANIELCLPRDECHTALIGRRSGRKISCWLGRGVELVAKWENKTIRRNNAYSIDRIDFGNGCQTNPVCNANNESLFEFFMVRRGKDRFPDPFSWTLTEFVMGEPNKTYLEGQAPYNQTSFIYETACVPRDSCLEFYMGYPPDDDPFFYDNTFYSIRLDGVIYSDGELSFGDTFPIKMNQTTNLGACAVETLCDSVTEDLFEMEFTMSSSMPEEKDYCVLYGDNALFDFESSSAIASGDLYLIFKEENMTDYKDYYVWSADYDGFEVDQKYAYMSCIPNDECAVLQWGTENSVTGYKLFQNGEELTERKVYEDGNNKGLTVTKAGACASGTNVLMPGVAVVTASLMVTTLLLICL